MCFVAGCGRTQQSITIHTRYVFNPDSCVWLFPQTLHKPIPVSRVSACFLHSGIFSSDGPTDAAAEASPAGSDAGQQCAGWKAASPATTSNSSSGSGGGGSGLQAAVTPWPMTDYSQQEHSAAQAPAYTATPALSADVYMQTLCPSYTMLTYTHTPLLTNFGVSNRQHRLRTKTVMRPDL